MAGSSAPATVEDPNRVFGKRTPSSSPKASTSTPNGRSMPRARISSSATMPATTPSGPSYRPPSMTVSMCEPMSRRLSESGPSPGAGRKPCMVPAASMRTPQAGAAHPLADDVRRELVLGRQVETRDAAGVGRDRGERVDHALRLLAECQRPGHGATRSSSRKRTMRATWPRAMANSADSEFFLRASKPARMSSLVAPRTAKMKGMP